MVYLKSPLNNNEDHKLNNLRIFANGLHLYDIFEMV